jgi:FtsH-binding integral membrane protein
MFQNNQQPVYTSTVKTGLEATFMAKVMTFFALAIFSSAVGTYVTMTYFMQYFIQTPALMYILFAAELGLVFTARFWSTKIPLNRFLFALFAFITGVTIAPLISILLVSAAGTAILTKALTITAFTFTGTALFGWTTKFDLSGIRGFLTMGLIGMIIVAVIGIFLPWGNTMEMVYSGIGVLLFSAYTAYDIQKLKRYPEDRYIDAALALYLDIFNLFIFVLRLLTSISGRD